MKELELRLAKAEDEADILRKRLAKLPSRQRPHYTPSLRFRILRFMKTHVLSLKETAAAFLVAPQTVARWFHEATRHPERATVGSLVKPTPPVRRFADVVRHLVQQMDAVGFGGKEKLARTLARANWRISDRAVGTIRREKPVAPPPVDPSSTLRCVQARYPNHVWMMDVTEIPSLFRIGSFKLVVVLDVFARMPLAGRVFLFEPTAHAAAELFGRAVARHGAPRHFVSDRGSQFTDGGFRDTLKQRRVGQRFGAVGRTGSIAVIERFWKSLKQKLALHSHRPLTLSDIEGRLRVGLLHYAYLAYLRPHQALGGAVPAEVYFGISPAHERALPPPRGRPGQWVGEAPFEIAFLDADRRHPFLVPRAA